MPLFVISFKYLAELLMNFWHTRHICRNLPFVNTPLFVTSFEVLPDRVFGQTLELSIFFGNLPFSPKFVIFL